MRDSRGRSCVIDPEYPTSPTDPPFCRPDPGGCGAFRGPEGTMVVHDRENHRAWIRSDASVDASERR
jgi:hypothetical protein